MVAPPPRTQGLGRPLGRAQDVAWVLATRSSTWASQEAGARGNSRPVQSRLRTENGGRAAAVGLAEAAVGLNTQGTPDSQQCLPRTRTTCCGRLLQHAEDPLGARENAGSSPSPPGVPPRSRPTGDPPGPCPCHGQSADPGRRPRAKPAGASTRILRNHYLCLIIKARFLSQTEPRR